MEEIGLFPLSDDLVVNEDCKNGKSNDENHDAYAKLKALQHTLKFLEIQEEYIKDEQKNLKRELLRAQEEVKRIQSVPLVIGQFIEVCFFLCFFFSPPFSFSFLLIFFLSSSFSSFR